MKFSICVLFLFLLLYTLSGCGKDDIPVDKDHLIIGNWEFIETEEMESLTIYHMKRTSSLSGKYGSTWFSPDGNYLFNGSWGFTGQSWQFNGTWSAVNDTLISVEMIQPFQETWKMAITKLDKNYLDYYYLYDK
jgi:hypothetical protein